MLEHLTPQAPSELRFSQLISNLFQPILYPFQSLPWADDCPIDGPGAECCTNTTRASHYWYVNVCQCVSVFELSSVNITPVRVV